VATHDRFLQGHLALRSPAIPSVIQDCRAFRGSVRSSSSRITRSRRRRLALRMDIPSHCAPATPAAVADQITWRCSSNAGRLVGGLLAESVGRTL
jgi:hypothetical protein